MREPQQFSSRFRSDWGAKKFCIISNYNGIDGRVEIEAETSHVKQLLIHCVVHLVREPVQSKVRFSLSNEVQRTYFLVRNSIKKSSKLYL